MANSPKASAKPRSLTEKRKAAQKVLWWRSQTQGVWFWLALSILAIDIGAGGWLVVQAADESNGAGELVVRLFGDAEEAAWLGWLTYFGWLLLNQVNRARKKRRSARLARLLLRRGHPKWFHALSLA